MKRKMRGNFSLGKRLILNVLLFLIVPLVLVAIIMNIALSNAMSERICRQQFAVLKQCEFGLSSILEDMEYLSLILLSNENVQTLVNDTTAVRTKFDLSNDIQALLNTRDYIQSICISKESDIVFQFRDIVSKEDKTYQGDIKKLGGRTFWSPSYELKNRILSNEPVRVISVMREIRSLDTWEPLAIERLSIAEETICSYYNDLYADDGSMLFLMDNNGTIISSPDKKIIGKNISGEEYIEQVFLNQDGFFKISIGSKSCWVFQLKLPVTGWFMIQVIPDVIIHSQFRIVNFYMVFSIFLCIIFAAIFYFLQRRNIVKPIEQLSQEMLKVRAGDFRLQLTVKNKDEIGNLSLSFVEMVKKLDELINRIFKMELAEKDARLKMLESQIDPHFLFNTLDTLRWIVIGNGDHDSARLVGALANIFRQILNNGKEMTTISNEVKQAEDYMMIQSYRFGDRIQMDADIDPDVLDCRTPKLIIQPLVENAIKHGLECKLGPGHIQLTIKRVENSINISVEDDGLGADEELIQSKMHKQEDDSDVFALKNIDRRVKIKFGSKYGLFFSSKRNIGTKVVVVIPVLEGEEHETPNC